MGDNYLQGNAACMVPVVGRQIATFGRDIINAPARCQRGAGHRRSFQVVPVLTEFRSPAFALLFCACSQVLIALITATNWACVIEPLAWATRADARDQVVALPGGARTAPVLNVMPPDSALA